MYCHDPAYLRKRTEEISRQQLSKNSTQEERSKEAGSHKDRLHQETMKFLFPSPGLPYIQAYQNLLGPK